MNYMEFIWLAVAVVAAVVEAAVPALVSIWFVPGSILALAASLLGGPLWLQMALFVGATVLAILFTRPQPWSQRRSTTCWARAGSL